MRWRDRCGVVVVAALAVVGVAMGVAPATATGQALTSALDVPPGASSYVPTVPQRVLDTRTGVGGTTGPLAGGATVSVSRVALGIPAGAVAVAVNVTATGPAGAGYVTLWPAGAPRPLASNVNMGVDGATVANLALVPVSSEGLSVYVSSGTHVLLDLFGWFVTADRAVAGGRMVPVGPDRLLDTRLEPGGRITLPGRDLPVAGRSGVPADASAAVVNVTLTDPAAAGYVSAWPAGQLQPSTSVVNGSRPGQTVANLAVVPLGEGGRITLGASSPAHVVVDLLAFVSGPGSPPDTTGLFVPLPPARIIDSRSAATGRFVGAGRPPIPGGHRVDLDVTGQVQVPDTGVGAVLLTLTAVDAADAGFLSAYPDGRRWPGTSSVNLDAAGQTRANLVLGAVGHEGHISLYGSTFLDVVADVAGYLVGEPATADPGEPLVAPPAGRWSCTSGEVPVADVRTIALPRPTGGITGTTFVVSATEHATGSDIPGTLAAVSGAYRLQLERAGYGPPRIDRADRWWVRGTGWRAEIFFVDADTPSGPQVQAIVDATACGTPPSIVG